MSAFPIGAIIAMQSHQRMMQDAARRRRRQEEEERQRQAAEKRRREERKLIEHRKNSPVICNNEEWQINRCVKAISMQSCVQDFITAIEEVRPTVIEREKANYDRKLIDVGFDYESDKNSLDTDIDKLRELGISIDGDYYTLSRLAHVDNNMAKPIKSTETYGNRFTIMNGQPIALDPSILSIDGYFEKKYQEMNPEELEKEFIKNSKKVQRYQKVGKLLKFLLKTQKYIELKDDTDDLAAKHSECELRREQLQSYKSLTKEQLEAIKSYFLHMSELVKTSDEIKVLFDERDALVKESNERVFDLAIKEVISNNKYSEVVAEVYDFINRVYANDEETMKQVYELVKGEYPIEVPRRFIYDLIISNRSNYTKDGVKEFYKG